MIGGYSFISLNKDIDNKIRKALPSQCKTINLPLFLRFTLFVENC